MNLTGWLEEMHGEAWAMEPQRLTALAALGQRAAGLEKKELAAAIAAARADFMGEDEEPLFERSGSSAVVKISGVLVKEKPWWFAYLGVDATETPRIAEAIGAALEDDEVESIVLLVSSPGGQAQGVAEVADAIKDACKAKSVECVIDGLCASGAYWLASQADAIAANKDAYVGSIGVYQVVVDSSAAAEKAGFKVHVIRSGEHKGMGVGGAPITDKQIAATQELVDGFAALFKKSVKSGRAQVDDVDSIATGQVWLAKTAKSKGLVDTVESVSDAFDRLTAEDQEDDMPPKNKKTAAEGAPETTDLAALERARVAEFKAAFPRDLAFAIEQYESGATVEQAKAAFAEVLEERLAETEKAKVEAEAQLEQAKKPRPAAPAAGTPVPFGGDPGSAGPERNFVDQAKAYAKEHACKIREAMSAIAKADPASHFEWKESQPLVKKNPDRGYARSPQKLGTK